MTTIFSDRRRLKHWALPIRESTCLLQEAQRAWSDHPAAGVAWGDAVRSCRRRPPLDPHSLSNAIVGAAAGRPCTPAETAAQDRLLACAARRRGNIPVTTAVGQGFYIPAAAQEALLVELLGLRGAGQIDRLADRFRAEPGQGPPGPQPAALPPDPLPAVPPLPPSNDSEDVAPERSPSLRRRGRGRGRARGRGARGRGPARGGSRPLVVDPVPDAGTRPADPASLPLRQHLRVLDTVDLREQLQRRVFTLQAVPAAARGLLRATFRLALQALCDPEHALDPERDLAPRMLLLGKGASLPRTCPGG